MDELRGITRSVETSAAKRRIIKMFFPHAAFSFVVSVASA